MALPRCDTWPHAVKTPIRCALSCANPLSWFGKFRAKKPKNRSDKEYSDRGGNHTRNRTGSNRPKHERADERRGRDKGGEKGDKRRKKKKKGG